MDTPPSASTSSSPPATSPSASPSGPRPPILVVADRPWGDENALRMWMKLLRSTPLPPDRCRLTDSARGRGPLWDEIRASRPRVVLALGHAAAKLLLRGKSSFTLAPVVGVAHRVDYIPWECRVVPAHHPEVLRRRSAREVREMVQILTRCKNFDEGR